MGKRNPGVIPSPKRNPRLRVLAAFLVFSVAGIVSSKAVRDDNRLLHMSKAFDQVGNCIGNPDVPQMSEISKCVEKAIQDHPGQKEIDDGYLLGVYFSETLMMTGSYLFQAGNKDVDHVYRERCKKPLDEIDRLEKYFEITDDQALDLLGGNDMTHFLIFSARNHCSR